MNANNVAAMIVSTVQKSNLNFYIQESPYSLNINLRKSFIKNRNGATVSPSSSFIQNNNEVNDTSEKLKVEKLELENSSLTDALRQLQVELQKAHDAVHEFDKLRKENIALKHDNDNLKKDCEKLLIDKEATATEMIFLENKNNSLEEQIKGINEENERCINKITSIKNEIDNKLTVKEVELKEAIEEKIKLEEKVTGLLDVLYGCPECGCNACECTSSVMGENSESDRNVDSPPPFLTHAAASYEIPAPLPPPPSSGPPWTPPPTPPCESCGGINFGPSPSSLCFVCISPPESKTPPDRSDSPSWTPPGTPPQQREGKARIL